jgi:ssDNA-binding Zn-finger/Zn-ribbon topoisomerase 1
MSALPARRSAALMTVEGRLSEFVVELVKERQLELLGMDGEPADTQLCPECKTGSIVQKQGQYGPFMGCNNFPQCRHIVKTLRGASTMSRSSAKAATRTGFPRAQVDATFGAFAALLDFCNASKNCAAEINVRR